MPLFSTQKDLDFMEGINAEMFGLYYHAVDVYKLQFNTDSVSYLYHEDINRDIADTPTYSVPGYVNVEDNGIAALYKQGQQIDRELYLYFSRKLMEDILTQGGFNKYTDVPTDGDVVIIQDLPWEIITVDPHGYHSNNSRFPFEYECHLSPWQRTGTPKDDEYEPARGY